MEHLWEGPMAGQGAVWGATFEDHWSARQSKLHAQIKSGAISVVAGGFSESMFGGGFSQVTLRIKPSKVVSVLIERGTVVLGHENEQALIVRQDTRIGTIQCTGFDGAAYQA